MKLRIDLVRHIIENRFNYKRYKGYQTYFKLMQYYDKLINKAKGVRNEN
jgi:hypothetical protein